MASAEPAKARRPGAPAHPAPGLRERKKQKTKDAIQRTAMRLFQNRGYEETTIEDIAAAVEISPSTFFNYFPTKEDVVLYDAYDPVTIAMLLESPSDESLDATIRRVVAQITELMEQDRQAIFVRAGLIMEVPELRQRMWEELERTNVLFTGILAQRTGRSTSDFELRVTVRIVTSAMYEAAMEWWRSKGHERLPTLVNHALDVVEAGARLGALSSGRPKKPGRASRRS